MSDPASTTRHAVLNRPLQGVATADLFNRYTEILAELRARGVVRTANAPAGDYAEYLVARAFGGELAPNSEKSWDVLTPDGLRLQVKCRVVFEEQVRSQRQLSPFRSFDFDAAVIVLLDGNYRVWRAWQVPVAVVQEIGVHNTHVNGLVLFALEPLLTHPGVADVTETVQGAAEG